MFLKDSVFTSMPFIASVNVLTLLKDKVPDTFGQGRYMDSCFVYHYSDCRQERCIIKLVTVAATMLMDVFTK